MSFDPFVIPFTAGLVFLVIVVLWKFGVWLLRLPRSDKKKFIRGVFSSKLLGAGWKVVKESLFHLRMYRINPVLGYMHMSFAFGWFMLILVGNIETRFHSGAEINPPYYPIFFRFFEPSLQGWNYAGFFGFLMDLLLLYVLSGFFLAVFKRIRSRVFGMKKTTKPRTIDRFAMASLWLIFPLRLLAESFTAGVYGGGHFLTGSLGDAFAVFLPVESLMYPAWWAYSLSLGVFFISVPFSRYMHIPTEILLIAFKRFGIKSSREYDVVNEVEVHSCPRCGVCIDVCQISAAAGIHDIQNVYLNTDVRFGHVKEDMVLNCLMCGRCQKFCPVGIHNDNVRLTQRVRLYNGNDRDFTYLPQQKVAGADVVYFAGCMSHLTPSIPRAMTALLQHTGVNYIFLDQGGSVCCGRPLMLAGELESAKQLITVNTELIRKSGAKLFVTSCPICYRVFKEDYDLGIEVMHHSQYLLQLAEAGKLELKASGENIVFHDPCDLGRGTKTYEPPRQLLKKTATLLKPEFEKKYSLCCGGALGDLKMDYPTREKITDHALEILLKPGPGTLITACPLCKKTFAKSSSVPVMDIAEWLVQNCMEEPAGIKEPAAVDKK